MATSPDSEGEIPDTPPEDQFSFRRDHDGRSALPASGRNDRDPTQGAEGDAPFGEGRRVGRPLQFGTRSGVRVDEDVEYSSGGQRGLPRTGVSGEDG